MTETTPPNSPKKSPKKIVKRPRDGKPVGRPAWIPTPEIIERVAYLAKLGLTHDEIAHSIGIGLTTFHYKKIEYPELDAAIKRGRANGVEIASSKLLDIVMEGNNVPAITTFLKLCHGRSERTETKHSGNVDTTSKVEWIVQAITPAQIPKTEPDMPPTDATE